MMSDKRVACCSISQLPRVIRSLIVLQFLLQSLRTCHVELPTVTVITDPESLRMTFDLQIV